MGDRLLFPYEAAGDPSVAIMTFRNIPADKVSLIFSRTLPALRSWLQDIRRPTSLPHFGAFGELFRKRVAVAPLPNLVLWPSIKQWITLFFSLFTLASPIRHGFIDKCKQVQPQIDHFETSTCSNNLIIDVNSSINKAYFLTFPIFPRVKTPQFCRYFAAPPTLDRKVFNHKEYQTTEIQMTELRSL